MAREFTDVVVVDEAESTERRLIEMVENSEIDAAVRGTARATKFLKILRSKYDIARIAVLETYNNKLFLLSPVGVDEGKNIVEKLRLIEYSRQLCDLLELPKELAILSGGRYEDIGRDENVDKSLAMGELLAKLSGGEHYEIRLEDAVNRSIVIAPDGISGNLIFRALCYLGKGMEYGAVYFGTPYKLIDTSRSQTVEGFVRALALASVIC
ncbi:MAG: methanogenesis marker protein Mmp4/MtxX [Candidatus Korarchaeum sp.]|nr:methanogenesis marker protein Mmp4/MtxX [Candidatus Korarchaeum sp.]